MKRFQMRLDKELHDKLREESFKKEKSMNEILIDLLEEHYKEEKDENKEI